MGPWAGQLVFAKWSKIEALFSPRHSKDKVSLFCWNKERRQPRLRSRKTSKKILFMCVERLLGSQKGRRCHSIICVDMHPQASAVEFILTKVLQASWGGLQDRSGVKKETG